MKQCCHYYAAAILVLMLSAMPALSAGQGLPPELCRAMQTYIAQVDSAQGIVNKSERDAKYAAAKESIKAALSKFGKDSLFVQAASYADQTETVVNTDPTNSNLPDLLDKRLRIRAGLLELCGRLTGE